MDVSRTVTAVFSHPERRALVVKSGEPPSSSIAAESELPNFGYGVKSLRDPSEQTVLCLIPHYKVFMFQGHSQPNGIEVNPPTDPLTFYDSCQVEVDEVAAANAGTSYKLVYLMGCNNGNNHGENWMSAFSASCFIGWYGYSSFGEHKQFDSEFWTLVESGSSVREAYNEIFDNQVYPKWYWEVIDGVNTLIVHFPVCNGDTNLNDE